MKIGIVLSGGMAKGAYQIGALRAVQEFIPLNEIEYFSCASIGVLNGYAFATGQLDKGEEMWLSLCNEDNRMIISQILRSNQLQQNIVNLYVPGTEPTSHFYCSLLDFSNRTVVYKDLSKVEGETIPLYLKASVAMPIYNRAVKIGEVSYYDGAMADNIPVMPFVKLDLDYIICVYFDENCYRFETPDFDKKVIKITFPSETIVSQSIIFSKKNIEKMVDVGYERTKFILGSIMKNGYQDVDDIIKNNQFYNKNAGDISLRITGDMLVSNINRVAKRLTSRKIK